MNLSASFFLLLLVFSGPLRSQDFKNSGGEPVTHVVAVFPTSDSLPANLLRMYVQFSQAMRPIDNLEKIKILDEDGQEIRGAIFNNSNELWNDEQTQLTLIFDPSRVKTGLRANEEMGRALIEGKKYQLVIDSLKDAEGNSTAPFSKSFIAIEEDLNAPTTADWTFVKPNIGSREPMTLRFPEPLDYLGLLQRIQLTDREKKPVSGRVEISVGETEWRLYPAEEWAEDEYILFVHSRLEDPSGNNLNGLFDHAIGTLKNEKEGTIETITIQLSN
ncbi:MAG: hypothetical protein AAGC47_15850 [Bacteroidota bacterium]